MSNAVQKWGICKTVCAQGCVGFPRAVLCSSSREFLERSLLPSPGTALTAGLLQPWRWKHNLCEPRIPPTKGCWGKQTFKANLPRATNISSSALKACKAWHSEESCRLWQAGLWDVDLLCYQHLFSLRDLSSHSSLSWLIPLCLHHFQHLCPHPFFFFFFPRAVCSAVWFCANRGAGCSRDISRRGSLRISAMCIKMLLPKWVLTWEIFRFHLEFSAGSPAL